MKRVSNRPKSRKCLSKRLFKTALQILRSKSKKSKRSLANKKRKAKWWMLLFLKKMEHQFLEEEKMMGTKKTALSLTLVLKTL